LRGRERLREEQEAALTQLSEINDPLFQAYLLKEQLRQLWSIRTRADAEHYLDSWIALAEHSGCKAFERLAETFRRHREGVLAYFDHPITSGPLEGLNNRIKTLKRQAYGFRDMGYFKLLVLHLNDPLVRA
ncbi:transposase, partial [Halorhodospira halophila]|uniref:transposase n=1 Tax=Halorhodospira halophila TaxID=1053 RepID=UPI001914CCF4